MSLVLRRYGDGPPIVMIHGSAANFATWNVQLASLQRDFTLFTYDRESVDGDGARSVEQQADDAAGLLTDELDGSCSVVGSSFGAIVALELARRYPEIVKTLILCEPPLPLHDALAPIPAGFACRFDTILKTKGGTKAAEFFLRCVLGDRSFEQMPKMFRDRAMAAWRQIRADMSALSRYRTGYLLLREEIHCPVVLVGGENSASVYREVLEALHWALPGSQLRILRGAGHMMHVDAHRQFNELLREHCRGVVLPALAP